MTLKETVSRNGSRTSASGIAAIEVRPVIRLRWWTLIRWRIPFRLWGWLRRLVEVRAFTVSIRGGLTNTEREVLSEADQQAQQRNEPSIRAAVEALRQATAKSREAVHAEVRAEHRADEPVRDLHGATVSVAEAEERQAAVAARIRREEDAGMRRHRPVPRSIILAADGLFVFDIAAWFRLMSAAFNIDWKRFGIDWLLPVALSLVLPALTYVITKMYAHLLRERRLEAGSHSRAGRWIVLLGGASVLLTASVLTFLAMYQRIYADLRSAGVDVGFSTVVAIALAFAIAVSPWLLVLARTFHGSPEVDEVIALGRATRGHLAARSADDLRGAQARVDSEFILTQGIRDAELAAVRVAPSIRDAWRMIRLAREIRASHSGASADDEAEAPSATAEDRTGGTQALDLLIELLHAAAEDDGTDR